jgi:hypothetical protein
LRASNVAVVTASDNGGVDETDGVSADEELGRSCTCQWAPQLTMNLFAAAVPDCCSETFILLVLLRFKQCAPSRFIRRIHP